MNLEDLAAAIAGLPPKSDKRFWDNPFSSKESALRYVKGIQMGSKPAKEVPMFLEGLNPEDQKEVNIILAGLVGSLIGATNNLLRKLEQLEALTTITPNITH